MVLSLRTAHGNIRYPLARLASFKHITLVCVRVRVRVRVLFVRACVCICSCDYVGCGWYPHYERHGSAPIERVSQKNIFALESFFLCVCMLCDNDTFACNVCVGWLPFSNTLKIRVYFSNYI